MDGILESLRMCSVDVPLDLAVRQTCDEESGLRQLIDVLRKQTPF